MTSLIVYSRNESFGNYMVNIEKSLERLNGPIEKKVFDENSSGIEILSWARENEELINSKSFILGDRRFVKYVIPFLVNDEIKSKIYNSDTDNLEGLINGTIHRGMQISKYPIRNYSWDNKTEELSENFLSNYFGSINDKKFYKKSLGETIDIKKELDYNYSLFFKRLMERINKTPQEVYIVKDRLTHCSPFDFYSDLERSFGKSPYVRSSEQDEELEINCVEKLKRWILDSIPSTNDIRINVIKRLSDIKLRETEIKSRWILGRLWPSKEDEKDKDTILLNFPALQIIKTLQNKGLIDTANYDPTLKGMIELSKENIRQEKKSIKNILLLDDDFYLRDLCYSNHSSKMNIIAESLLVKSHTDEPNEILKREIRNLTSGGKIDYVIIGNNLGVGLRKASQVAFNLRDNNSCVVWNDLDRNNRHETERYASIGYNRFLERRDLVSHLRQLFHIN